MCHDYVLSSKLPTFNYSNIFLGISKLLFLYFLLDSYYAQENNNNIEFLSQSSGIGAIRFACCLLISIFSLCSEVLHFTLRKIKSF